jgi:hypothetical protein
MAIKGRRIFLLIGLTRSLEEQDKHLSLMLSIGPERLELNSRTDWTSMILTDLLDPSHSMRPVSAITVPEIHAMENSPFPQTHPLEPTPSFGIGFSTEMLLLEEKNIPLVLM